MPNKIERLSSVVPDAVVAHSTIADATAVPYGAVAGGLLFYDSTISGTPVSISWYAATDVAGTYVPVRNSVGVEVTTTLGGSASAYPIPDECFGAPFIKAVTDAGSATCHVTLKG